jgi:hypothetical protein
VTRTIDNIELLWISVDSHPLPGCEFTTSSTVLDPPRTGTSVDTGCDTDDEEMYCHRVVDGRVACGKRLRGGGGIGRHVTSNPGESPCNECGLPRCPDCEALR